MRTTYKTHLALVATLAAIAACSAQRDTAYQGEPLAVLHGTAEISGVAQPPALDVELVWLAGNIGPSSDGGDPGLSYPATSKVAVNGAFPSAFTMNLMTPPGDDALIPCLNDSEPAVGHFGFAHIQALLRDGTHYFTDLHGDAFEFRVVYVDQDITACDILSTYTSPVLSKGYHLLQRIAGPCPGVAQNPEQCASFSEVALTTTIDLPVQADPLENGPFISPTNGLVSAVTSGPNCVDATVPTDPSTGTPCRLFLIQTDTTLPFDCSGAGLTAATPLESAQLVDDSVQRGSICEVAQVPPSAWVDGSCAQSAQAGWCYLTGSAAGSCAPSPAVYFSSVAPPPPGAYGQFICP